MKKLLKRWQQLPVKFRACANIVLICLCVLLIYIFVGAPAITPRQAFRRAEKAQLVGPAEILEELHTRGYPYSRLILADDGDGVILFTYNRWNRAATKLLYAEKTGDLTLAAAPDQTFYPKENHAAFAIILFHEGSRAVRAELEFCLTADFEGEPCKKTYSLQSLMTLDRSFLFSIEAHSQSALGAEGQLLLQLQSGSRNSIPATVRLYDADDNLIREETVLIQ